ncbi:MAG: hypothetical protein R3E73_15640, partial [Porticoccaceae bacterium]
RSINSRYGFIKLNGSSVVINFFKQVLKRHGWSFSDSNVLVESLSVMGVLMYICHWLEADTWGK